MRHIELKQKKEPDITFNRHAAARFLRKVKIGTRVKVTSHTYPNSCVGEMQTISTREIAILLNTKNKFLFLFINESSFDGKILKWRNPDSHSEFTIFIEIL